MKLLKLKIQDHDGFRSLQQGFEINFHSLSDKEAMEDFRPFCFAGLNGSGKSNVLEALSSIFYHMEVCVARYLPESIKNIDNFKRNKCFPDAFTLEYLIGQENDSDYVVENFHKVSIIKKEGGEPKMEIQEYPFSDLTEKIEISLYASKSGKQSAPGKAFLPDQVIGYSSGENEILSLPFIKSRLIHLDEFKQASKDNYENFEKTENSLIYIDSNMSQAVLLTCLLFESDETLKPLRDIDNTGILGLKSFRININLLDFEFKDNVTGKSYLVPINKILENYQLDILKKCSTMWYSDGNTLWLDFYVDKGTQEAFKYHFKYNSFKCFQMFSLLYELNSHFVDDRTKENIYQSKGVYTDWKLPVASPGHDVFHFLDFYILKEMKKTGEIKELLLRSFSDGEHQFLHTMGICLLLKDKRSILLLDEPETHFNPSWRAKFVKILNESITLGNSGNPSSTLNVHLLKDVLLTSHSPFIISDCLPDNVILFEKDSDGKTLARKASELGIDTYGTSVNLISNRIFKSKETIGKYALSKLYGYRDKFQSARNKDEVINELNEEFGDSIEKLLLIKEMTDNNA